MRPSLEKPSHTQHWAQRFFALHHVDTDIALWHSDGLLLGALAVLGLSLSLLVAHVGGTGTVWEVVSRHVKKFRSRIGRTSGR